MARFGRDDSHALGRTVKLPYKITGTQLNGNGVSCEVTTSRAFGGPAPAFEDGAYECTFALARKGFSNGFFWWSQGNGVEWIGGSATCPTLTGTLSAFGKSGGPYVGFAYFNSSQAYPYYQDLSSRFYCCLYAMTGTTLSGMKVINNYLNNNEDLLEPQEIGFAPSGTTVEPSSVKITVHVAGGYTEVPIQVWLAEAFDDGGTPDGGFYLSNTGWVTGPSGDLFSPSHGAVYLGGITGVGNYEFDITSKLSSFDINGQIKTYSLLLLPNVTSAPGWRASSDTEDYIIQTNGISFSYSAEYTLECRAITVKQEDIAPPVGSGLTVSAEATGTEEPVVVCRGNGDLLYSATLSQMFGGANMNLIEPALTPVKNADATLLRCKQVYPNGLTRTRFVIFKAGGSGFSVISKGGAQYSSYQKEAIYLSNGRICTTGPSYSFGFYDTAMQYIFSYGSGYPDAISESGYAYARSNSTTFSVMNLVTLAISYPPGNCPVNARFSVAGNRLLVLDPYANNYWLYDISIPTVPALLYGGSLPANVATHTSGTATSMWLTRTPDGIGITGDSPAYDAYPEIRNIWTGEIGSSGASSIKLLGRYYDDNRDYSDYFLGANYTRPSGGFVHTFGNAQDRPGALSYIGAAGDGAHSIKSTLANRRRVLSSHQIISTELNLLGDHEETVFERHR